MNNIAAFFVKFTVLLAAIKLEKRLENSLNDIAIYHRQSRNLLHGILTPEIDFVGIQMLMFCSH